MQGATKLARSICLLFLFSLSCQYVLAAQPEIGVVERINEVIVSLGAGNQPKADQHNQLLAIDYNFIRFNRSPRSGLSLGVSYTRLKTSYASDRNVNIVSLYPQLTLRPARQSMADKYFFVRALGPSYISNNRLGERQQSNHFSFLAQVGVGMVKPLATNRDLLLQLSWRHFSNANLFSENDSFDAPFVFSVGYSF